MPEQSELSDSLQGRPAQMEDFLPFVDNQNRHHTYPHGTNLDHGCGQKRGKQTVPELVRTGSPFNYPLEIVESPETLDLAEEGKINPPSEVVVVTSEAPREGISQRRLYIIVFGSCLTNFSMVMHRVREYWMMLTEDHPFDCTTYNSHRP